MLKCPECNLESATLRGWSRHMGAAHGGHTEEQKMAAIEAASSEVGTAQTGFKNFDEAAAAAPETEEKAEPKQRRPRKPKEPTEQEKKLAEMRTSVSAVCATLTVSLLHSWLGVSLNRDESNTIASGWSSVFEAIGISFNFEKLNYEITSPWAMLLFPALSILMVLAAHVGEITSFLEKGGATSEQSDGDFRSPGNREN